MFPPLLNSMLVAWHTSVKHCPINNLAMPRCLLILCLKAHKLTTEKPALTEMNTKLSKMEFKLNMSYY